MSEDNVTPMSLDSAAQVRMAAIKKNGDADEDDVPETHVTIEFYGDGTLNITHNTATIERLLYAAEMIRQYALLGVTRGMDPE